MNRPFAISFVLLGFLPCLTLAQNEFRAIGSGEWSDSRNWEIQSDGVWLKPPDGVFPGEAHHRNVDVVVDNGTSIVVNEGQNIEVNSLTVMEGRVLVNGLLVIGPVANDTENKITIIPSNGGIGISSQVINQIINDAPEPSAASSEPLELLQNVPNPISMATGDWTTFSFFINTDYPVVRLSIYNELGYEVQRLYEEYHPFAGWKSLKMNTASLQSGSYQVMLQAGASSLHRSLTIIR